MGGRCKGDSWVSERHISGRGGWVRRIADEWMVGRQGGGTEVEEQSRQKIR